MIHHRYNLYIKYLVYSTSAYHPYSFYFILHFCDYFKGIWYTAAHYCLVVVIPKIDIILIIISFKNIFIALIGSSYINCDVNTIFIRSFSGWYFSGKQSHVRRPISTTFFLLLSFVSVVIRVKYSISVLINQINQFYFYINALQVFNSDLSKNRVNNYLLRLTSNATVKYRLFQSPYFHMPQQLILI